MRLLGVSAAIIASLVVGTVPAYADTETGAPSTDNSASTITYTTNQQAAIDDKEALATVIEGEIAVPESCPTPGCSSYPPPSDTQDPPTLYWEGQGDTDPYTGSPKLYTCGPAATRNMVTAMGASDPGEGKLAQWENTDLPQSEGGGGKGTGIANIVNTLNNHYGSYGTWEAWAPSAASKLMSHVVTDIYKESSPLVANVYTYFLPFWNQHGTDHYDLISGYYRNAGLIRFAEEWNTADNSVGTSQYGNPYGFHNIDVNDAYSAVGASPTHDVTF
jgi:hypothetical protein